MKRAWPMTALTFAVVAFILRAAWILYSWHAHGAELEFDDEHLHWQLATNLVQHGRLASDTGLLAPRMPLYPLFLAVFAGAGSYGILIARLAQALLGAATTFVACRFARTALGQRAALLAGLLVCIDPYAIFFANLLLSEVPFTLIAVSLTACAWKLFQHASDPGARTSFVLLALLGPATILTRPESLGWVALLWIALILADRNRPRAVRRVLVCLATLGVLMLPWGLRNRSVLGSFAWLSTNGGITLYDSQGPQADGSSNQDFLRTMPELANLGEVQRDDALRSLAIEQMQRDPARVARLAVVKFLRTWNFIPNVREYHGGATALISAAYTALVLALATGGLWRARNHRWFHGLIWLPVVYFTLVHCIYIGSLRYRVPLMPFVALAAAATAVSRPRRAPS